MRSARWLTSALWLASVTSVCADDFENPPIRYSSSPPTDAVARLQARLDAGDWKPDIAHDRTFLREVLSALEIPSESQVLVFSKTSQQNDRISPRTPRAIYFSDDVYVGWVQGGAIEIASVDPRLGPIFYMIDRHQPQPRFRREAGCLSCHASGRTGRVPGLIVRSVYPSASGLPYFSEGSFLTTPRSPLEERWGGWYVTGRHAGQRHMGNAIAESGDDGVTLDVESGANLTSLEGRFPLSPYLETTSDIVALMVLEHQVAVHNALTRANFKSRQMAHYQRELAKSLGEPSSDEPTGVRRRVIDREVENVVRELLFSGAIRLRGGLEGSAEFQRAFRRGRRADRRGRSLRDFHLESRVFRYRLSFLIYSASFDALPDEIRTRVFARLHSILRGEDRSEAFEHLTPNERRSILEILLDTKENLPASWRQDSTPAAPQKDP